MCPDQPAGLRGSKGPLDSPLRCGRVGSGAARHRASAIALALVTSIGLLMAIGARAQAWPTKPVRLIVPFAGGGGTPDSVARIMGQALSTQTGQGFVVDNRPGANGLIGAELLAKAPPDGHTLMIVSTSYAINPSMYRKLPYDPLTDIAPVTNLCAVEGLFLTVNPGVPAKTLQEFIAWTKQPDAKVSYGTPGIGNSLHLATELFNNRAGTTMVHVPYKGSGPAMAAVMGGEIQAMFITPPQAIQGVKAGQIRALAYTGKTRASFLPEVPTMAEAGLEGMVLDGGWFALFAPGGTPPALIERLHLEARKALESAMVRERFDAMGLTAVGNSPAEFRAFVQAQMRSYAEMVKLAKIQPE